MNRATNDGGDFRALPVPYGEPADLSAPPASAESYLQLVRALSRRVPDVMVMEGAGALECAPISTAPAPSIAAASAPGAASATWAAATLESFSRLRATLLHVAIALEEGRYVLAPSLAGGAPSLSAVSAAEWRLLIAGGAAVGDGGRGTGGAAFAASQVWSADDVDDNAEEWGEEEGADDGDLYDDGEGDCSEDDGGGGGDGGDGAAGHGERAGSDADAAIHKSTLPLAPLLPTVAALDQLTVLRLLNFSIRDVRTAWTRGGASKQFISPALASWLYALLAALQLPLLNTTAAAIRDLFTLLRSQRDALAACSEGSKDSADALARAGVETLFLICGDSFGQRGGRS